MVVDVVGGVGYTLVPLLVQGRQYMATQRSLSQQEAGFNMSLRGWVVRTTWDAQAHVGHVPPTHHHRLRPSTTRIQQHSRAAQQHVPDIGTG
jgi:hypothetical protein